MTLILPFFPLLFLSPFSPLSLSPPHLPFPPPFGTPSLSRLPPLSLPSSASNALQYLAVTFC